jgi:hypothetical protein
LIDGKSIAIWLLWRRMSQGSTLNVQLRLSSYERGAAERDVAGGERRLQASDGGLFGFGFDVDRRVQRAPLVGEIVWIDEIMMRAGAVAAVPLPGGRDMQKRLAVPGCARALCDR